MSRGYAMSAGRSLPPRAEHWLICDRCGERSGRIEGHPVMGLPASRWPGWVWRPIAPLGHVGAYHECPACAGTGGVQ